MKSRCWLTRQPFEVDLLDLERYNAEPVDRGVVAWPVHHSEPNRARDRTDITFEVKAQVLVRDPTTEEVTVPAKGTSTEENYIDSKDEL